VSRATQILELVNERARVEVAELAERCGVSRVTIRKDLDALARQGLIRREHGVAVAIAPDNLLSRLAVHREAKLGIARAAAALVPEGATVMVESGSTCALLAAELAVRPQTAIVTNSAFIADSVRGGAAPVVLLGGDYQPESQVLVGPLLETCAAAFHVPLLFVGLDGYSAGRFYGKNLLRAAAVRAMAAQAERTVVVSESAKFAGPGAVELLPAARVSHVVTDPGLDAARRAELAGFGITVVLSGSSVT